MGLFRSGSFLVEKSWMRYAFLCLIVITLSSCGTSDPPKWKDVLSQNNESTEQRPETTAHLIVYLDVSASMPGYVSPDGETIFGRTLQELRGFVTTFDSQLDVMARRVGATVSAPESNMLLMEASRNKTYYDKQETDLAGAIRTFSEGSPPARYHILVTDGVQSTKTKRQDDNCDSGSDQFCVRRKISELLEKGWGGCILGIRSQFHGDVYSESSRRRGDPYGIKYDSIDDDPESYRPFYLYIFSPDPLSLDKFVEELKERIRPLVKGNGLRELALTLPYTRGFAQGELKIPNESFDLLNRTAEEKGPARFTLRLKSEVKESNAKSFQVSVSPKWSSHAMETGTEEELINMIQWDLEPVYAGDSKSSSTDGLKEDNPKSGSGYVRFPVIKLKNPEKGKTDFEMTAHWPTAVGEYQWRAYKLVGRLNLENRIPPWVRQWSTYNDDRKENGNKTFDLETVLLNLWRNPILQKQEAASLYIRVGPD